MHAGDPAAAVVAETCWIADDAADLVPGRVRGARRCRRRLTRFLRDRRCHQIGGPVLLSDAEIERTHRGFAGLRASGGCRRPAGEEGALAPRLEDEGRDRKGRGGRLPNRSTRHRRDTAARRPHRSSAAATDRRRRRAQPSFTALTPYHDGRSGRQPPASDPAVRLDSASRLMPRRDDRGGRTAAR